jgi:RHS repeat-associated protein
VSTQSSAAASCPAEYSFDANGICTKVVAQCWSAGEGEYCNYFTYTSATIYSCPAGQTLYGGTQCQLTNITYINNSALASPVYGCPAGQRMVGTDASASCQTVLSIRSSTPVAATATIPASPIYAPCASGYTLNGNNCVQTTTVASIFVGSATCLAGDTSIGSSCRKPNTAGSAACKAYAIVNGLVGINYYGSSASGDCEYRRSERCPAGATTWANSNWTGNACYTTTTQTAVVTGFSCPANAIAAGNTCLLSLPPIAPPQPTYACPAGTTLSGNRCFANGITSSTVANRTLTFVYGPEHQRIAQRTQLDASAPASMAGAAGIVYYLNGQNNDLGYEKEVKDGGLIEHKHYLSAGGIVFAMQISRAGNLSNSGAGGGGGTRPAQTLQYLHHDHLGSVAVVTDDTGSVIERLAYDPWGKRRFPNGMADKTDSIVGLTLDRGFTMHEHLDEMGVIHMNGRIYDPLIGRFMSADPFIQAPECPRRLNIDHLCRLKLDQGRKPIFKEAGCG